MTRQSRSTYSKELIHSPIMLYLFLPDRLLLVGK